MPAPPVGIELYLPTDMQLAARFPSIADAARAFGVTKGSVARWAASPGVHKGYVWAFADPARQVRAAKDARAAQQARRAAERVVSRAEAAAASEAVTLALGGRPAPSWMR